MKKNLNLGKVLTKEQLKQINGKNGQQECESQRNCTWYEDCVPSCLCGWHLPPC